MSINCDPRDVALKSFFLGPQAENSEYVEKYVRDVFNELYAWRKTLYPKDGCSITAADKAADSFSEKVELFSDLLRILMTRFRSELPKFSPRYIGHMLSDISLPALMGHIVTLLHNPNNVSGESSKVGTEIEVEAIKYLNAMIAFPKDACGHFTSGGTIANFEALVRARSRMAKWMSLAALLKEDRNLFKAAHMGWDHFDSLRTRFSEGDAELGEKLVPYNFLENNPFETAELFKGVFDASFKGPVLLIPNNKHYSWKKGVSLLGLGNEALWEIDLDEKGALCVDSLKALIEKAKKEQRPILAVVSVAGTTELAEIDPVDDVDKLLNTYRKEEGIFIWHHVDAAYGGFYCAMLGMENNPLSEATQSRLKAIGISNSVTIDPHKLGYVPYASGAFLCRSVREYFLNTFGAPYINFSKNVDKGPYTLEGSRSAGGAVATWLTANAIGLNEDGYGRLLKIGVQNKISLEKILLQSSLPIRITPSGDTNLLCFNFAKKHELLSEANRKTLLVYEEFGPKGNGSFIVSKTALNWKAYGNLLNAYLKSWNGKKDDDNVITIRVCLMNIFFDTKESDTRYMEEFVASLEQFYNSL